MFTKLLGATCAIATTSIFVAASARDGYRDYDAPSDTGFALSGGMLLGGSFGLAAADTTLSVGDQEAEVTNTRLTGTLLFGRFLADNFFLGGAISVEYTSEDQGDFESSQTTGLIEVIPRYYIPLSAARAAFFLLQANLGYAGSSVDSGGDEFELSGPVIGIAAGLSAVLGDADDGATVDLLLNLRHSFLDRSEEFATDVAVGVTTVGVSVGIGTYF